jgi:hypothetical protein
MLIKSSYIAAIVALLALVSWFGKPATAAAALPAGFAPASTTLAAAPEAKKDEVKEPNDKPKKSKKDKDESEDDHDHGTGNDDKDHGPKKKSDAARVTHPRRAHTTLAMSNPISPDAVPGETGPASGLPSRQAATLDRRLGSDGRGDSGGGLIARIVRRWWVVVGAVFVAVVVAFAYLVITPKIYTATCVLAPERRLGEGGPGNVPPDEFLSAQRQLLLSTKVLGAATGSMDASTRTGPAATPQALHDALRVQVSAGEQTIVVKLDSPDPQAAARTLAAVADAYLRAQGDQRTSTVSGLGELRVQRDTRAAERASAEKALNDFKAAANVSSTEADKAGAARLEQLRAAMTTAQLELTNASAAFDAAKDLLADPQKAAQTIEVNRSYGIFAGLDQQ